MMSNFKFLKKELIYLLTGGKLLYNFEQYVFYIFIYLFIDCAGSSWLQVGFSLVVARWAPL